jgi:hypothetical protein
MLTVNWTDLDHPFLVGDHGIVAAASTAHVGAMPTAVLVMRDIDVR